MKHGMNMIIYVLHYGLNLKLSTRCPQLEQEP